MSKSIKLKNDIYIDASGIDIGKGWNLHNYIKGYSSPSSQNINTGIYNKLCTISLKGAYMRTYHHIELFDVENFAYIGDLYICIRSSSNNTLSSIYLKQKTVRDSNNFVPYLYITKNSTSEGIKAELWVYIKTTWTTPYYRLITNFNLSNLTLDWYQTTKEPTYINKYEFDKV